MGTIVLPEHVHDQIRLLSSAWKITEPAVVERLVDQLKMPQAPPGNTPQRSEIPVYAIYRGQRTEGLFDPVTDRLKITNGELGGREFRSPTGAARAVVNQTNPSVHPNRNGWDFWSVTATGQTLQSVRRRT